MNKRYIIIIIIVILVVLFGAYFLLKKDKLTINDNLVCTMEAKICPDGSSVGRTGPACEFAACPSTSTTTGTSTIQATSTTNKGYLSGRLTISPICPVERVPPEPQCAPKGYSTPINISSDNFFKQISSDANGYFNLELSAGTYSIKPIVANVMPYCEEMYGVLVKSGTTTTVQISCDSGIR